MRRKAEDSTNMHIKQKFKCIFFLLTQHAFFVDKTPRLFLCVCALFCLSCLAWLGSVLSFYQFKQLSQERISTKTKYPCITTTNEASLFSWLLLNQNYSPHQILFCGISKKSVTICKLEFEEIVVCRYMHNSSTQVTSRPRRKA